MKKIDASPLNNQVDGQTSYRRQQREVIGSQLNCTADEAKSILKGSQNIITLTSGTKIPC